MHDEKAEVEANRRLQVLKYFSTAAIFAAAILVVSCGRTVDVIIDCPSPNRTATATFYGVHGGGAAGWAYFRVSVRGAKERLNPERYQFAMRHGYDVRFTWKAPSELMIEYPDEANVDLQLARGGRAGE